MQILLPSNFGPKTYPLVSEYLGENIAVKTAYVNGNTELPFFPCCPGGYCHIWAIWVCAAVKGMVFKQFTLG